MDDGVFIDRDLEAFSEVLNVLRSTGQYEPKFTDVNKQKLFEIETEYWGIRKPLLEIKVNQIIPKNLIEIMQSEPQNVTPKTLEIWKKLGPIDIFDYYQSSKMDLSSKNLVYKEQKTEAFIFKGLFDR